MFFFSAVCYCCARYIYMFVPHRPLGSSISGSHGTTAAALQDPLFLGDSHEWCFCVHVRVRMSVHPKEHNLDDCTSHSQLQKHLPKHGQYSSSNSSGKYQQRYNSSEPHKAPAHRNRNTCLYYSTVPPFQLAMFVRRNDLLSYFSQVTEV